MATRDADVLAGLRALSPEQFEHFVADLWAVQGYDAEVTPAQNDQGVDVIAIGPEDERVLIQAKRYGADTTVGPQPVRALIGVPIDADRHVLVTTSSFTNGAKAVGYDYNGALDLVDGPALVDLINEHDLTERLADYLEADGVVPAPPDKGTPAENDTETAASEASETAMGGKGAPSRSKHLQRLKFVLFGAGVVVTWLVFSQPPISVQNRLLAIAMLVVMLYGPVAMYRDQRLLGGSYKRAFVVALFGLSIPIIAQAYYVYRRS